MCKKSLLLLFLLPFQFVFAQTSLLTDFPEGYTPKEVGKRLAYHFVEGKHMLHIGKWISYPETFTWNGGLKFAALTNDQELVKLLQNRFELLFTTEKALLPIMNHVDVNMFGSLPLELYKITKDQRYLDLGLPYADTQWQLPANAKPKEREWDQKGYSWQTRLWIDDMYMITIVQTQAYRVTGDRKYIDRAAREMVMYLDELQCPNGLFYHAPDVPFYWGRGNGWMAAGMAELLSSLPEDSEYRPRILHGYRTMMKSLKKYQSSNGLWHQLLDKEDSYEEITGSSMFVFGIAKGVKEGWLHPDFIYVAWQGFKGMLSKISENGDVTAICVGTGIMPSTVFYYNRPTQENDPMGEGPVLRALVEMIDAPKYTEISANDQYDRIK